MADKLVAHKDDQSVIRKFVDQGGGVWAEAVTLAGGAAGAAGYPAGATPVVASDNQANVALSASIPAVAGKTSYLAGLSISGGGSTAGASVLVTISGLLGGTRNLTLIVPVGSLTPIQPLNLQFNPPLPASGLNVGITVGIGPGGAGNSGVSALLNGYQL